MTPHQAKEADSRRTVGRPAARVNEDWRAAVAAHRVALDQIAHLLVLVTLLDGFTRDCRDVTAPNNRLVLLPPLVVHKASDGVHLRIDPSAYHRLLLRQKQARGNELCSVSPIQT